MSKKEAYQQRMQAQMDEWSAEIDRLKAKADKAEADVKIEYYEEIDDLRGKQKSAKEKLDELRQAGDGAWEDIKVGAESAWHSLGNAIKRAGSRFK